MAYTLGADRILVVAHSPQTPSDAEWQAYVDDAERWVQRGELRGALVLTAGGGPTSGQRRALERMQARIGALPRTAVVTDKLLVRGIVIAIGLFNANIHAFRPTALDEAMTYLEVAAAARPQLIAELERQRLRLRA